MLLCESLVDTDIPRHNKMREVIISHWQKSFKTLKLDLSVSLSVLSSCSTNQLWLIALLWANQFQFHLGRLVKCKLGGILGVDCTLDFRVEWMPYAQGHTYWLSSPQEEMFTQGQSGKNNWIPTWSGGCYAQHMSSLWWIAHLLNSSLDWPLHTQQCWEQCSRYARAAALAQQTWDGHCCQLWSFESLCPMLCAHHQHMFFPHSRIHDSYF